MTFALFISISYGLQGATNYWTGASNPYWHNAANWSLGHIPYATDDVVITSAGFSPRVDNYHELCKTVTINSGVTLRIYEYSLTTTGDVTINGILDMVHTSAKLYVGEDITWGSGSSASMTASSTIYTYRNWIFSSGANVQLNSGYVDFKGTSAAYIRTLDSDCYFNHIRNNKDGTFIYHSSYSTAPLDINGNLYCYTGSEFKSSTSQSITLNGFINNMGGSLHFDNGTFVFDGGTTTNNFRPGDYFFNLTIDSGGSTIFADDIQVKNDLTIQGGFTIGSNTLSIQGDWINTAGSWAFPHTGRVIFNGSSHQYCNYSNHFNILEVDKPSGAFRINSAAANVYCEYYDWTDGAVDVLEGMFQAWDLSDNNIWGSWYLNTGGTINIYNTDGYIHLNGDLHIYGGTMNVYGGINDSYWPGSVDAEIEMSGGELIFHDRGVYVRNTNTLIENITGGTISIAGNFRQERSDFNTGCVWKLTGNSNSYIRIEAGNISWLEIHKTGGAIVTAQDDIPYTVNRLYVYTGSFDPNEKDVELTGVMRVYDNLIMDDYDDVIEVADFEWKTGANATLTDGWIYVRGDWTFEDGIDVSLQGSNRVYFISPVESRIYCYDDDAEFNYMNFNKNDGSPVISYLDPSSTYPVRVGNVIYINNDDNLMISGATLYNDREVQINSGGKLTVGSGGEITGISGLSDIDIEGDFEMTGGDVFVERTDLTTTGTMTISGGNYISNFSFNAEGFLEMTGGQLVIDAPLTIEPTFSEDIWGGTIRIYGGFTANTAGTFQPSDGTVEFRDGVGTKQYININSANYFHDFVVHNTGGMIGGLVPQTDLYIMGDLTISQGKLLNEEDHDIYIQDDWTNNVGDNGFHEGYGTVTFTGNPFSVIFNGETFYNLTINKSNHSFDGVELMDSMTLKVRNNCEIISGCIELNNHSTFDIDNDLTIYLDAGLNAYLDDNVNIFLEGNWLNLNTEYTTIKGFNPGISSTVTFDGDAEQELLTFAPQEDFWNLVINKSSEKFRSNSNLHILGDLSVVNGEMEDKVTGLSHEVYGDVLVETTGTWSNYSQQNTVTFAGLTDQTMTIYNYPTHFWNFIIDKTAKEAKDFKSSGEYLKASKASDFSDKDIANPKDLSDGVLVTLDAGNIICQTVTLDEGILSLAGSSSLPGRGLGSRSSVDINDGGHIIAGDNSSISVGQEDYLYVNSGGTLEMLGSYGNEVTFRCLSDYYGVSLQVNTGGTIVAQYTRFDDLNNSGVLVQNGAFVNTMYSFNNCSFKGFNAPTELLSIWNDQVLTIDSAHFWQNTYGANNNVYKALNAGRLTFNNASGFFAGPTFELDPFDRIDWGGFVSGLWVGEISSDWHDYKNWDDLSVPDAGINITIPAGTPFSPNISGSAANCNNITIETGAMLSIQNQAFTVSNDISISGELQMNHTSAQLIVGNDILWEAGATANITGNAEMIISGDWYFNAGANVQLNSGYVEFAGSNPGYIRCFEPNCYFNHIRSAKTSNYIAVAGGSTADLDVNGNLYIYSGSDFNVYSSHKTKLSGLIENNTGGGLHCDAGEFVFDGGSVSHTFQWGDYFEDLELSSSGTVTINSDMTINNDLLVSSGTLKPNFDILAKGDLTIFGNIEMIDPASEIVIWYDVTWESGSTSNITNGSIRFSGDWTFQNGTLAQLGLGSTVYSVGMANHSIRCFEGNSSFGNLDIDMNSAASITHIFDGNTETVNVSGNLTVTEGIFDIQTAELHVAGTMDIVDGTEMRLGTGGLVTNDSFFTLNGYLNVGSGNVLLSDRFQLAATGELTINGGNFVSNAPTGAKGDDYLYGTFNMSSGLFELTNNGIRFGSTCIENISGGTIRTGEGFCAQDAGVFEPAGGIVEFTGTVDLCDIFCSGGNYFHDFIVNKDPSATVNLNTDITVANDLSILSGALDVKPTALPANNITIGRNWTNNVGDAGFVETDGKVTFNGSTGSQITTNETFYNLEVNNTLPLLYWVPEIMPGVTVNVLNNLDILDGTMALGSNTSLNVSRDIHIYAGAGLYLDGSTGVEIELGRHWTNDNPLYDSWVGFNPGTSHITFNGTGTQIIYASAAFEDFYEVTIDKTSGSFAPNNNIAILGDLTVLDGSFSQNTTGLDYHLYGDVLFSAASTFYPTATITFKGTGDQDYENQGSSNGFFNDVVVDKSSKSGKDPKSNTLTLQSYINVLNDFDLTVESGNLDLNGNLFICTGNVTVNSGGNLIVDENAELTTGAGDALTINNGGTLTAIGTAGNEALITHHSGYFDLNIESGGQISAEYAVFEYISANGVNVKSGAVIDPAYTFTNCKFHDGETGGTLLTIDNNETVVINGAEFPTNTWGGTSNVKKTVNSGSVSLFTFSGDFSGEDYDDDPYNLISWQVPSFEVDIKVYLEGPFNGTTMNTDLNPVYMPLSQPYNTTPWNYSGTEVVGAIPNAAIADWVLIELRDAADAASAVSGTMIAQQAGFLQDDGTVVGLDGLSLLSFNQSITQSLFVVVWHRNHLGVMSAFPLTEAGGVYSYDFTNAATQTYGGILATKEIATGIWGMVSGDGDADGQVTNVDKNDIWSQQAGFSGYLAGDFSMDGQANNLDKNDLWAPNSGSGSQVPDSGFKCQVPE